MKRVLRIVNKVPKQACQPKHARSAVVETTSNPTVPCGITHDHHTTLQSGVVNTDHQLQRTYKVSNALHGKKTVPFLLTDIGEGTTEVEILEWFFQEGDTVEELDEIVKVESDKATVDITSKYDGVIKEICYEAGSIARVGKPLIYIEVDEELLTQEDAGHSVDHEPVKDAPSQNQMESTVIQPASSATTASIGKVLSTPAVRRLAIENDIDLLKVQGTGKSGRILKEDVLNYIKHGSSVETTVQDEAIARSTGAPSVGSLVPADWSEPVRGLTRSMIKSMTLSNDIPTLTLMDEVDLTKLVDTRTMLKPFAESQDVRLSYMPFFIKAASLALSKHPRLNARLSDDKTEILFSGAHNIGVAMDSPQGLIVPNIKNIQSKSILDIAQDLNRLQRLGAEGKLTKEDLTGATFTLSNIGAIGGTYATPLISPPESAIAALGKMKKIAVFDDNDNVVPAYIMNASFSADHRFIDGASVGRFINDWKSYLEKPEAFMISLR